MGLIADVLKKIKARQKNGSFINRAVKLFNTKSVIQRAIEQLKKKKQAAEEQPADDTPATTPKPDDTPSHSAPEVKDNPMEELPPPPDQQPDIVYEDDCDQVVFPDAPPVEIDPSKLDYTNPADIFQAITQEIRTQANAHKTGEPIQNKQRYKRVDDGWTISVKEQGYTRMLEAGPILAPDGTMVEPLRPLLADESGLMIVHLVWDGQEHFLCSQRAKDWIDKMKYEKNPHRSPVINGRVEVKPLLSISPGPVTLIGCTIPIVHIDATKLETIGYNETLNLRMAGIADVDYIYETILDPSNPFSGNVILPKGLVQQINYTISRSQNRATGSMEAFSIPFMQSNYTAYIDEIRTLVGKSEQDEKVYYMGKLETFQEDVYPIWEKIVDDNNALKQMFYDGNIPNEITETEGVVQLPDKTDGKSPNPSTYSPRTYKRTFPIGFTKRNTVDSGSVVTPRETTQTNVNRVANKTGGTSTTRGRINLPPEA